MQEREHVVVLGGGFAGWYAARHLSGILPWGNWITLVDRNPHMLYTPMLTEVAGGNLDPDYVAVPIRGLPGRVKFLQQQIRAVDAHALRVELEDGQVLEATQLVLALGSTTSYHGIAGAQEHTITMKTLRNAVEARDRVDAMARRAAEESDPAERRRLLTFVVAGGGYTGVETIAALNERLRAQVREAGVSEDEVQAVLIEPEQRLMKEMPESLGAYGEKKLIVDGIRVLTGAGVKEVQDGAVELTNGERIAASLIVWDTGIEPSLLLRDIDVPKGKHHGAVVDATFRVSDRPGVWAVGDCAEIPQAGSGKTFAPTAQNAVREGAHLASNINAAIRARKLRPFQYEMLGQLAIISRRDAVAEILGIRLRGSLTWALWWAIYTAKLPNLLRQGRVLRRLVRNLV